MKTAMQELWDYIDANYHEEGFNLYDAKEISLEREKEQINKACYDGYYQEELYDTRNYYNQTYNQESIPKLLYKDGAPMRAVKLSKEARDLLDEAIKERNQNK